MQHLFFLLFIGIIFSKGSKRQAFSMAASSTYSLKKSNSAEKANVILLVEDNLMNQRLTGFMLNNLGISFDVCSDGVSALKWILQKDYALVLLDIELPRMNGLNVAREIRKALQSPIPIVALTAHDSKEEIQKCKEAGMNDFLVKPLDQDAFYRIVTKYLGLNGSV